jgi:hypothetical protein
VDTDARDEGLAETRREAQRRVARAALAAGATYARAAETAGVSERSVARWMGTPEFARAVSEARAEQVNIVTGLLAGMTADAVEVLGSAMAGHVMAERLRAAQMVLGWATRLRRDSELEMRLIEVEVHLGFNEPSIGRPSDEEVH